MSDLPIKKDQLKEFGLSSASVRNRTSVILLAFMIFFFGIGAYESIPKEQFPEISMPQVYINTVYFGNSAEDIEDLITRPIEKELQTVTGIDDITSTSLQDYSVIIVEYTTDVSIDEALRKTKDAVDKAKTELPNDLDSDPLVEDINFSEFPIFTVNLSGDFTNDELRDFAEYLEDEIEEVKEVSDVVIKGALDREVKIDLDLYKMQATEVSFTDVQNAIASENITLSGGEIVANDFRRAVRVVGQFENTEEINNIVVKSEFGKTIYLRDIANVKFGYQDRTSYARSDLNPVVSLDVIKRSGENLLFASDKTKALLKNAQENILPEGLNVALFNDQSVNTRDQVSNLENSIISGVILVVLVLLFFLGFRNALFVGVAIPLSMLMSITILQLMGITMNTMTLFSLVLALGLLVDNGIVVVENVYRYMQEGYDSVSAARYGVGEVALPIIASTATTLAAFIPLMFWPGIMGEFMQYLPLTLIIVLASSLFVALLINPVLTALFMRVDEKAESRSGYVKNRNNTLITAVVMLGIAGLSYLAGLNPLGNFLVVALGFTLINFFIFRPASFSFQNAFLPWLDRVYSGFVRWALRWGGFVFSGTIVLLMLSFVLMSLRAPKVDFFPAADPIYVNAFIEMPLGTDIEATNELMKELEAKVIEAVEPNKQIVEEVLSQIGKETSDPQQPPEPGASPHKGRITVSFIPVKDRGGISTYDVMEDIRNSLRGYPGVQITIDKNAEGPPTGKPINIEIVGEDINRLSGLADDVINFLNGKNIPGVEELKADVNLGKPELLINIDREAARRYEVNTFAIADAIRTSVYGKEVSQFKEGEDEYPIFVRLDEKYRNSVTDLMNQKITFRDMATGQIKQVPISAVADIEYSSTYSSIKRKNLDRVITVYSNILDGYNANEVVAEVSDNMNDFKLPDGYSYTFTGEQQEQAENMAFLTSAFLIALFAIFLIIVAQFNSIVSPFIIILSVVFSTIGVLLGYVFTGSTIVIIMTGVGVISLAGVVVNNAIVLIDYINLVIKRHRENKGVASIYDLTIDDVRACVVEAGGKRLRPVLLTAITTVLGLIPLAVGFNVNFFSIVTDWDPQYYLGGDNVAFWGPMAWTVIYGLVFATFLTLVVVPVMYWLAYRLMRALHIWRKPKAAVDPALSSQLIADE